MDKHGVALVLDEIATLLDATGDNRFKARAFRTAARAIEKADADLATLIAAGELPCHRTIPSCLAPTLAFEVAFVVQ